MIWWVISQSLVFQFSAHRPDKQLVWISQWQLTEPIFYQSFSQLLWS